MIERNRQVLLSEGEAIELIRAQKELKRASKFDPFLVFDEQSRLIQDMNYFSESIKRSLKAYEELSFVAQKLKERQQADDSDLESNIGQLLMVESKPLTFTNKAAYFHFNISKKLEFKLNGIFELVDEYLGELQLDEFREHHQPLLSTNLLQLKTILESSESQAEKVPIIAQEFSKIKYILSTNLLSKTKKEAEFLNVSNIEVLPRPTRDKSVMTQLRGAEMVDLEEEEKKSPGFVDFESINVIVDDSELSHDLLEKVESGYPSICFNGKDSCLMHVKDICMVLKKNGKEVYTTKNRSLKISARDAIFCKGAYYIFEDSQSSLLRKAEDRSDPQPWWSKKKIRNFDRCLKIIRKAVDGSAIYLNCTEDEMIVIEVRDDGSAGRELAIRNGTGSPINCHQALSESRILAINEKGLMVVHKVDSSKYNWSREVGRFQIKLKSARKEGSFYVTVCERFEFFALSLAYYANNCQVSRLQIYRLCDLDDGKVEIRLKSELDLWGDQLTYYFSISLSQYAGLDKLILLAESYNNSKAHIYCYDTTKNEFFKKESKSLGQNRICYKLRRYGNEVCGVLYGGKILKFTVNVTL